MNEIFSSHFTANEERRNKLWQDCFFVFDTNVLTSVYKRSDGARDALYKIIGSLGDRLWIPYQVIFELLDNRAGIAHTQSGLYVDAIKSLRSVLVDFESSTSHPFLSEDLYGEFSAVSEKVIAELEKKRDYHSARITDDDVKQAFSKMFTGKVGAPFTDEQVKAIIKEGEVRYANKIPPGFEDINKHKGSVVFSDVCKRYGDLIIWKQIIEKAKALDKPVIFVTGEQKDDWWDRCGGKTIGPLPKLIDEFSTEVGQDFFIFSHYQFLELANKYLEQTTSLDVIKEVREAAISDEEGLGGVEALNHTSRLKIERLKRQMKDYKLVLESVTAANPIAGFGFDDEDPVYSPIDRESRRIGLNSRFSKDERIMDTERRIGELIELIDAEEHLMSWRVKGE